MRHSVKRRVIHLAGYDPMSAERFHGRFAREAARFREAWGADVSVGPLTTSSTDIGRWTVTGEGPDWRVEADHILLRWDDLIEDQRKRPVWERWPLGLLSFFDFAWHGVLWRYLRHGPRYLGFFLFPYLVMLLCLAAGAGAGYLVAGFGLWIAVIVGVAGTVAALLLVERLVPLDHLLDDWIFASSLVRRLPPALAERLALGQRLIEETPDDTDLVVIGHSLGATLAVEMLAKTVSQAPQGRAIRFVTLGSSILKIALHGGARRLRDGVSIIANAPRISWVEYQAVNDVMNFFGSDPVQALALTGRSPIVRKARFSRMLKPAYYRRIRFSFFRLHCQFISGNDLRSPYDYLMMIAGPFSVQSLAESPHGPIFWLQADGSFSDEGRARADQAH